MSDAYREMPDVVGTEERESEAIRRFGQWRDRTKMRILLAFALLGLVPAGLGYWLVQEAQFQHNRGRALLMVNVAGAAAGWGIAFAIGAVIARRAVRRLTPGKLDELARAYEVPRERLTQTTDLVDKL